MEYFSFLLCYIVSKISYIDVIAKVSSVVHPSVFLSKFSLF